jgi:hypothetical protein
MTDLDKDAHSEAEMMRRRDEAIRRALDAPPKPHKTIMGKSAPPPRREPKGSNKKPFSWESN